MRNTTHEQNKFKRYAEGMEEVEVEDDGEDEEARKDGGDGKGGEGKKMVMLEDTEEEYDKKDVHKKDNEGDPNHLV